MQSMFRVVYLLNLIHVGIFCIVESLHNSKRIQRQNVMAVSFRFDNDSVIILELPGPNTLHCNENAAFY